jgi:hypothetical protein
LVVLQLLGARLVRGGSAVLPQQYQPKPGGLTVLILDFRWVPWGPTALPR